MDPRGGNGAPPQQQDELELVERVMLRFASVDTDEALTAAVNKFLPPCILKLASHQEGVRKKVMELLTHLNKRIKDNPRILLPVDALLVQYQDPSATSFVINFTIIYIKMGFPRVSQAKRAELIPAILSCLDGKPVSHQDQLLFLILPYLDEVVAPDNEDKKKHVLGLTDKPQVRKVLMDFLLNILLLHYGSHPSLMPPDDDEPDPDPIGTAVRWHAGLSLQDWKRVAGDRPMKAEDLEQWKVKILKFLGKGLITESEIALHLIVGSSDSRHSVASQAESEIRKLSSIIDWNDSGLITQIFGIFLGTRPQKEAKADLVRAPANTRIRLKLINYLLKSNEAAARYLDSLQVIFDLLFGNAGNTNVKLKQQAAIFIHNMIANVEADKLSSIGSVLMSSLPKVIHNPETSPKLRSSCYVAIGKLGQKAPDLVNKDLAVIQMMFEAMSTEDKETQMSVKEAMSLMASAFKEMAAGNLSFIEGLLTTFIEKDEPQVRHVVVQYAGEIFGHTHEASRYILLLGAGDEKEEVAKLALTNLYGAMNKIRQQGDIRFREEGTKQILPLKETVPDFVAMTRFVLDKAKQRAKTAYKVVVGDKVLAFKEKVYIEVLNYLRNCLLISSGLLPKTDIWQEASYGAPEVTKYLNLVDKSVVSEYVGFVERFVGAVPGPAQANALLQVVGCTITTTSIKYHNKVGWIKALLDHTRSDVREPLAEMFALVCGEMKDSDFDSAISDLTRGFKEKSLEFQHGIITALGYSIGRKSLLSNCNDNFKQSIDLIINQLDSKQAMILTGACGALGEVGRCGVMPLPESAKLMVVQKLLELVKSSKQSMKVREKAVISAGLLCVGDKTFAHRKYLIEEIVGLAKEIKDLELHLSVGEALVYAVVGPLSAMGRNYWLVREEDFQAPLAPDASNAFIDWIIDEICNNLTKSTHPNVKKAACLWLLAITKYGKDLERIQTRLLDIQTSFMHFLGDSNDIVQEAASKGLGLVYDSCREEQKTEIVNSLLATLTDGKREVQKVNPDTKIFEEGQMGKTPGGDNLSTYKELCSLATDLNQPDLIFKFMHLANYNAMWNSRKGAAFGFSSIAAKAKEHMEPHLPKIVPKLYRYQFDPTPNIQSSMTSIWHAIVPETTKTVDKYLPQILEEITTNLTSHQWRVRESCCMALQDLLRGRTLDTALDKVPELWNGLFRVMDDIKESVRLAATKAASSLSRASIKMCDPNQGAKASGEAVQAILAPLLDNGLTSTVTEVRAVVIDTIVKITKDSGPHLKGHLHILIPALLEAASELENKNINYISVRMANDPSVQEKLDMARITAAKSSPMMECVLYVLQYIDSSTLELMMPRILDLIKGNVGLGTKGSVSHLISTLTIQCPLDLQPFTGKILAAFVSGLSDRNAAVRKTYATAIGHLMKVAKDSSLEKLFVKLRTWYLEKEELTAKLAVAYTYEAVNRHNPDKMKSHGSQTMPLAFLAMHERLVKDENEEILEIWEEVWSDGVPGTEGGMRLYLSEIMALLKVAIESRQWKMKAQVARAMGKLASTLQSNLPVNEGKEILSTLLNSLAGRTWEGKEAILDALAEVCDHSVDITKTILAQPEAKQSGLTVENLCSCLLKECKKETNQSYRISALAATGRIFKSLTPPSFKELFQIVFPIIEKLEEKPEAQDEAMEKDDEGEDETSDKLALRLAVYECLETCWPEDADEDDTLQLLASLRRRVDATLKRNKLAIIKLVKSVMHQNQWPDIQDKDRRLEVVQEVAKILALVLAVPKSSQLRSEALAVLKVSLDYLEEIRDPGLVVAFKENLGTSLDDVVKDVSSDPGTKILARQLRTSLMEMLPKEEKAD